MKSQKARRFLLAVASVIFVLVCIELPALIGILDYRTVIGPYHAWWAPNIADNELRAIHRPHARQNGTALGGAAAAYFQIPTSDMTRFQWDVKYDHNGFRNPFDLKSADTVVIGDSFVEGLTVTNAELVTSQLAQLQGKTVANLGQSTYGPLQELIVLKRYGLPLRPHTVVWMFFEGNDLQDVIAYRYWREHSPTFWRAFWERCFTRSAYLAVKRLFAPTTKAPGIKRLGVCRASNGKQLATYFEYGFQPFSQKELSAIDETTLTLASAYKICATQRIRLIFVFVPTKFRVFHTLCQFPQESECGNWVPTDLQERLRSALVSISPDIGYLDLTSYLVDGARKGGLPYYPDDEHWSPDGHRIAAKAINDYLLSTGNK